MEVHNVLNTGKCAGKIQVFQNTALRLWRGGRGSAKSAAGERLRRQR